VDEDVPEVSRSRSDFTVDAGVVGLWTWERIRYLETMWACFEIFRAWKGVLLYLARTKWDLN